ncbi:MAG TPA: hypothetical protein VJG90_01275 [Candidatus Nanoarchaeia archaeon]|nr:hypothetical protein [Candidatus Nanoarchaeia archaeon]
MKLVSTLKEKLKTYTKESIVFTTHAYEQAVFRGLNIDDIKENIINPERLAYAKQQPAQYPNEEKYDCYFGYTPLYCHRYVLVLGKKCIVCTVIQIHRKWQEALHHETF